MTDTTDTTTDNAAELDRMKQAVADANAEAAKYRVEKKDAVEAAKTEVAESFASKITDLEAELNERKTETSSARTEVEKLKVTISTGIAADKALDFAELLKGETPEELSSHAEKLKELFTTDEQPKSKSPATDPTQGNQGKPLPLNGDPLLAAVTAAINR